MSSKSQEHPPIPADVAEKDVLAIVSVYHAQALNVNRDTPFRKIPSTSTNGGCHVFLHRVAGKQNYSFGRGDSRIPGSSIMETRDVYLPGVQVGIKQFVLAPIWDSDIWRLQSMSETVADVNGVPIRAFTNRTKKDRSSLPHAIHLKPSAIHQITINGLRIDIWLLKSVRDVYPTKVFDPQALQFHLQDVSHRPEQWARDRYILSSKEVSANSVRVLERFTGEVQTAKLFRDEHHGRRLRDEEFLKFGKDQVDASLVQYQQSVEIDNIPAVITSTHEGFESYAALQARIKEYHPGVRFSIATKLLRRLFSALDFLHFHGIIHGQVTQESVLLRLEDFNPKAVLLVDYSKSTTFSTGAHAPHSDMIQDGRAAMEIIEDCCDIWQLRKAATKDALKEEFMANKTMTAQKEHESVKRVVADFERKGGLRTSDKGTKLLRLLDQKSNNWHRCQNDQAHNATRREVGLCYKSNIDEMVNDWGKGRPDFKIGNKKFMILSLGHPWFDQLASQLFYKRWDTTPYDVCAKFNELAGAVEEPWQTFAVTKTLTFQQNDAGFEERCVMAWLASWSEAFPEWHQLLDEECGNHIRPQNGTVTPADIGALRGALSIKGHLPQAMATTFDRLMDQNDKRPLVQIEETYDISLHTPSRMFNITQLQHLASPDRFLLCINEGRIRCDNYVELRGEPNLQGCYVSLSLLHDFAEQLGLTVPQDPNHVPPLPTFDPSDFSRVPSGKIVLARTGLVAFASVTRTGDQCVFHAPMFHMDFVESSAFLPTYFGDMKVLPQLPESIYEYERPDHWSKFKTAEEIEHAANVGTRKILQPKGPRGKLTRRSHGAGQRSKPTLPTAMDETVLFHTLKRRQQVRSQARPPTKRNTDAQSSEPGTPTAKRSRPINRTPTPSPTPKAPAVSMSFIMRATERMERMATGPPPSRPSFSVPRIPNDLSFYQRDGQVNANLLSSPPRVPADKDQSFTVASGSFNLDDDKKRTEEWLKDMPDDEEDEPQLQGLFGFRFHHSHLGEGSTTEEDTPPKGESGNKGNGGNDNGQGKKKSVAAADVVTPTPTGENSTLSKSKARTPAQSFTYGQQTGVATPTSKGKGKATTRSFTSLPRRQNSASATPHPNEPTLHTPAATVNTPDPESSHPPDFSNLALTQHTTSVPRIPTNIYGNPTGAVDDWLANQMIVMQGGLAGDDMPDTDVGSWNGGEDMPDTDGESLGED